MNAPAARTTGQSTQPNASTHAAGPSGQFAGVQVLRFIAAALVVCAHASLAVIERLHIQDAKIWPTGVGVNIFFVISGFVMVASSKDLMQRADGWKTFAVRRIIRIVPMYWVATTLKLVAVLAVPAYTLHNKFDVVHTLCSYFFIPHRNAENDITPLHSVGWTLLYEMFFYAWFAVALFLRRSPTVFVSAVFIALVSLGAFANEAEWPAGIFYTRSIVLEFVLGMWLGSASLKGRLPKSLGLAALVLALGAAGCVWQAISSFDSALVKYAAWYIPPALLVAGVVMIEPWAGRRMPAFLQRLGDASYALYLFHPFMVPVIGILLFRLGLRDPAMMMALAVALPTMASVVIFLFAERPTTEYLKRAYARVSARPTSAARA